MKICRCENTASDLFFKINQIMQHKNIQRMMLESETTAIYGRVIDKDLYFKFATSFHNRFLKDVSDDFRKFQGDDSHFEMEKIDKFNMDINVTLLRMMKYIDVF